MKNNTAAKLTIDDISQINIHHYYDAKIPACCIIQLDSGIIAIGLNNGSILFFATTNLDEPYLCYKVDEFPIYSLLQIEDDQLICNSGPHLYLIFDNKKRVVSIKKKGLKMKTYMGIYIK